MNIVVQKFGGTSVRNLECQRQVMQKVLRPYREGNKVIVVLSAMSGETNRLLSLAHEWSENPDLAECDSLVSTGEQISCALFSMLLKQQGVKCRSVLGFQAPVQTDCAFGKARIVNIDDGKLKTMLQEYDILVVAGFQGCDENQRITTLGRGGSDTSAVALAAALKADVCEIYTDVPGVFTTDPNMCSDARKMDKIAYDEMLEMASMGAKVLQIRSVEFAKKYNVTVHVRSTFSDEPGTLVTQEDKSMESVLVSGIAYDKDQARITLIHLKDTPGVSAQIFSPLAEEKILVDMIVQNPSKDGLTDMTFTIPRADVKQTIKTLEKLQYEIGYEELTSNLNVAKVSIIGVGMRNHSGVASRAFRALADENVNILMISTSEIKITCLIDDKYTELAVRTLHKAFNLEEGKHIE
ncbi:MULTISPECIES: aspartate kinase [unclassified Pseudodesulfovibrio]|uniref:aspartate kinase n=1 Tax=unclassified Pseudodesulfovibrio TaxID=2661612 RepID=UPI000FEB7D0C|nr:MULTISPECIES: aspartate kinase [unclassified Pseudodesulfovibrio]MCJ2163742.1 aspartate kinase [Pseudodesulfovibrio sp. S3-i]RWU06107.1 aspartate kinase [Pseudodesulfovibrio sp. S3]